MKWRLIETAPMNGKPSLCRQNDWIGIARYVDGVGWRDLVCEKAGPTEWLPLKGWNSGETAPRDGRHFIGMWKKYWTLIATEIFFDEKIGQFFEPDCFDRDAPGHKAEAPFLWIDMPEPVAS